MKKEVFQFLVTVAIFGILVSPARGEESGAIDVKVRVEKIETSAGGQELFVPAGTIRPGDLLQYEVVYRIKGKDEVLELLAQLPIPAGMEYLPNSALPPKVRASQDGRNFSPVPLHRQVKLANGQEITEEVPPRDYRALGWSMRGFAPGDEITVSARFRVNFIPESGQDPATH